MKLHWPSDQVDSKKLFLILDFNQENELKTWSKFNFSAPRNAAATFFFFVVFYCYSLGLFLW